MAVINRKSLGRLLNMVVIWLFTIVVTIWLANRSKPEFVHFEEKTTVTRIFIASELTTISNKLSLLWTSTRDNNLRKTSYPCKHRYGLQLHINHKNLHLLLCILLAGDIATNPGPYTTTLPSARSHSQYQPIKQESKGNSATCVVINARSLKSQHMLDGNKLCNISRFQELVYSESADLVWVTETWLTKDIENTEILHNEYSIYRNDRESRAGGGVMLAVKSSSFISSREVVDLKADIEVISTELITNSKLKFVICCCYRPPNADHSWLEKFNSFMAQLSSRHNNIIICGDFNFPKLRWNSPIAISGADEVMFTEQLNDFFLTQVNTLPTRGNNVLDLVITSVPDQIENISKLNQIESGLFTDHDTIVFNLKTSIKAAPKLNRTVFDYRRGNIDDLCSALKIVDFHKIIESGVDINDCWKQWKDTFLGVVTKYIPTKRIKGRYSPPWMNGNIIHEIRKKEAVRRKLKSSPSGALRAKFKELRVRVKKLVRESRVSFFNSLDGYFKSNPKRFWSIFKLNNKQSSVPDMMSMNNDDEPASSHPRTVSTPAAIADLFNNYFTSVFSCDNLKETSSPPLSPSSDSCQSDFELTTEEVLGTLLKLDTSKATGPDGIPSRILKETAREIAPSLTQLFNRSLSCGEIPDEWKLANIVPVHKKGDKSHVENYRPISLLSIISKVLERCVLRNMRFNLLQLINSSQHGFIPGKSCTTQLLEVFDYIGSLLDGGKQTDVIYMDMSKAFDKVDHKVLIDKLRNCFGISGKLLRWFESYLLNRKQRVTVLGATSSAKSVLSGVPQGSILGPILFLLYVNDLPDAVEHSKIASFADDTKLFKQIDSTADASLLQSDLSSLENWSTSSGLVFNQEKCKCQRITRKVNAIKQEYTINNKSLVVTKKEKDLGIWITDTLAWSEHTHDRCMKTNKMLGFLRRSSMEITDVKIRRTLYLAIVRSALGYASQVWSPQSIELITRIERIQRRATKYILQLPFVCAETYKDRLISLDLLPICYWHEYLDLIFFFKAINNIITVSKEVLPEPIIPSRLTRSSVNTGVISFRPRKCKTVTYQRSFFIRVTRTYNSLPQHFRQKNLTLAQLKNLLLGYYRNAVTNCYDVDDARSWKSVCLKCNTSRSLIQPFLCCY